MTSLEEAFAVTEKTATSVQASAKRIALLAGRLVKATQTGNLSSMRRLQRDMNAALEALTNDIADAGRSWPLAAEEEDLLFRERFPQELQDAAAEIELPVHERGDNMIVFPSIVRVLPADRAVRVDRKKVSTVRPSYLAGLLQRNQERAEKPEDSDRFLESLYQVYMEITSLSDLAGQSKSVLLSKIFRVFRAHPVARRSYDATDFARDLYMLDTSGLSRTRKGATLVLHPPSSAARSPSRKDLFSFVGKDGRELSYYRIEFREED